MRKSKKLSLWKESRWKAGYFWHENCNSREVHTCQEYRANVCSVADRKSIKYEYGKDYKIRRLNYNELPSRWEDIQIHGTKSWKKLSKRKRQWK